MIVDNRPSTTNIIVNPSTGVVRPTTIIVDGKSVDWISGGGGLLLGRGGGEY